MGIFLCKSPFQYYFVVIYLSRAKCSVILNDIVSRNGTNKIMINNILYYHKINTK